MAKPKPLTDNELKAIEDYKNKESTGDTIDKIAERHSIKSYRLTHITKSLRESSKKSTSATKQPDTPKDESIEDFFKRFRSELEGKVTTLNARVKDAEKALEVALKELEDANAALAKLPGNDGPQG